MVIGDGKIRENPGTSMISKVKWKTEISCVPANSSIIFSSEFGGIGPMVENP